MAQPLVSIIVPNYNGKEHLEDCLSSLEKQTHENIEIILVDNNSADKSVEFVQKNFPNIRVVRNKENLGVSGANNAGLRIAKGELISLFNNDAVAEPNWLEELVKVAESDEMIGFVGGKIYDWTNKKRLQFAGAKIKLSIVYYQEMIGAGEIDRGQYDIQSPSDFVSACALLTKRKVVDDIGYEDEDFFIYFDETDYFFRAKKRGYKIIYVPTAVVYHKKVSEPNTISPFENYYVSRNLVLFYFKHATTGVLIPFLLLKLIALPSDMIKQYYRYRDVNIPITYFKANLWWMVNIPKLIKKRIDARR